MGFNLGLLGVAATALRDGYKKADKEARDEAFLQATRDYQLANAKEAADLRPDRMAANRASLGYATARDTANTGLLPDQTADTRERIELARKQREQQLTLLPGQTQIGLAQQSATKKDLAFKESQRPIAETIEGIRNRNTKFMVDLEAQELPRKAEAQVAQGILTSDAAKSHLIGAAASYLHVGDKESAIALMQRAFDGTGLFPAARGSKLMDIQRVDDGNGSWTARFVDEQGGIIAEIPQAKLMQAYQSTIGKKETVKLAPGEVLMGINQGKATKLGENTNSRYGRNGSSGAPAEVKMYQFLTGNDKENPIKVPMGHQAALDYIKQSKGKTKGDFLADVLAKDPLWMTGNPEVKAARKAVYEQTYDELHGKGGLGDVSGASNSGVDPKIKADIDALIEGGE